MVRARLVVAYHGAGFRGMAPNAGVRTVGGVLTDALEAILGHPVSLAVAGRTDAGVHAWGQVVSFDADAGRFDPHRLRRALTRMLGPEIVVRDARRAPDGYHARFSARSRTYRYTVLCTEDPDPFLADVTWWVPHPLPLWLLDAATTPVIGEHDFASFCRRRRDGTGTTVRRVLDARWRDLGEGLRQLTITAEAFCHQMVRSIVGTAVDAARGRIRPGDVPAILAAGDRSAAGTVAPPHGLCLWHVDDGIGPP